MAFFFFGFASRNVDVVPSAFSFWFPSPRTSASSTPSRSRALVCSRSLCFFIAFESSRTSLSVSVMSDSLTSRSSSESVAKLGEWFTSTSQHLSFLSSITSTPRSSKHDEAEASARDGSTFSFGATESSARPSSSWLAVVVAPRSICRMALR